MSGDRFSTVRRDLDEVRARVQEELMTVRELMDTLPYHRDSTDWHTPFQLHRLRRALRVHYLAMRLRDSRMPVATPPMAWHLEQ